MKNNQRIIINLLFKERNLKDFNCYGLTPREHHSQHKVLTCSSLDVTPLITLIQ